MTTLDKMMNKTCSDGSFAITPCTGKGIHAVPLGTSALALQRLGAPFVWFLLKCHKVGQKDSNFTDSTMRKPCYISSPFPEKQGLKSGDFWVRAWVAERRAATCQTRHGCRDGAAAERMGGSIQVTFAVFQSSGLSPDHGNLSEMAKSDFTVTWASSLSTHGEEKFPNIQSKPPLVQLEAISSCPVTCYLGEETDPHLSTTSFQLRCPSLDTLQHLNVSLVVRGPKLNTVFEVWPHHCRVQGHDHFPSPAGHAISDTTHDAIGFLGHLGTLLAHIQVAVDQHPEVLLCQAAFQPLFPKPVALYGVAVAQVQDPALGLVEPHTIDLSPSIQPVQVPL
ncbi:hypothetical protein QYF61_017614 [Mycteria americana]|uniref:Uncharacterized protein n=1 Tax=Mycteria americana TaxID=33587 RepID=A0AAN7RQX2_MYCAM|nr:hypothetical protein QYF61_017614 [Mycteria americana]